MQIDYDPAVTQYIVTLPADEEMPEAGASHATDNGSASDTDPQEPTADEAAQEEIATFRALSDA